MSHAHKLSTHTVLRIKRLLTTKVSMQSIVEDFGISLDTVQSINNGKTHSQIGSFHYPIRKEGRRFTLNAPPVPEPPRKVNNDEALDIYFRLEQGEKISALAEEYNVSTTLIQGIANRPMFRHVNMFDMQGDEYEHENDFDYEIATKGGF